MSTVTLYSHRKLNRNRQTPMTYATDPPTGGTMIVHGRNTNLFRAPAEDGYDNETKDISREPVQYYSRVGELAPPNFKSIS